MDRVKMRILIISSSFPPQVSGVSIMAENLADELNRGHLVEVISTDSSPAYKKSKGFRPNKPYPVHRLAGLSLKANSNLVVARPQFRKVEAIISAFKPDVIHLHDFNTNSAHIILSFSKHTRIPIVITHHFTAEMILKWLLPFPQFSTKVAQSQLLKSPIYRLVNLLYNKCDLVIIPNPTLIPVLKAAGLKTPVLSIPNGVNLEDFRKRPLDKKFIKRMQIDRPTFLFVGRLDVDKNLELLIEAFAVVKTRNPTASLVLVGSGVEEKKLKQQAKKLSIGSSVYFLGRLDNKSSTLITLYRKADVFVNPSIIENQSVSFIEAMAMGLPLVSFDTPLQRGFIINNRNGLVFSPHTAEELANCMIKLASRPDLRLRIGNINKKTARRYEIGNAAKKYVKAYQAAIKRVTGNHVSVP